MYLSPSDTYFGSKDECIIESYYDCLAADIIRENFKHWIADNCTKKCLPRYFVNNKTLQCKSLDELTCALNVIFTRYLLQSNCPRPCSIVQYSGKVDSWEYMPSNRNDHSFTIILRYAPPAKVKVYQEYLIYNFFDMFGSVGGTLGIFIGFSLNNLSNFIINILKNIRFRTSK